MNAPKVTDVMTHLVVTLRPKDTLKHAAQRLLSNRISGAPVADGGRLVGVVSEADLLQAYAPRARGRSPFVATAPLMFLLRGERPRDVHDVTVDEVMTPDVVSVSPETSVWEAASLIDRFGVRRLPVVDEERFVVGVVTRSDLVRVMARTNEGIAPAV
jgi:CBS domain-containing protein